MALAYVIGDKAEQAYRRGGALEKRLKLIDAWASYSEPKTTGNVWFKENRFNCLAPRIRVLLQWDQHPSLPAQAGPYVFEISKLTETMP